jgi:hypothetical protein
MREMFFHLENVKQNYVISNSAVISLPELEAGGKFVYSWPLSGETLPFPAEPPCSNVLYDGSHLLFKE